MDQVLEAEVYHYLSAVLKNERVTVTKEPTKYLHYRAFLNANEVITIAEEPDSDFITVHVTQKVFLYEHKNNTGMQRILDICKTRSAKYLTETQQICLYTLQSIVNKRLKITTGAYNGKIAVHCKKRNITGHTVQHDYGNSDAPGHRSH